MCLLLVRIRNSCLAQKTASRNARGGGQRHSLHEGTRCVIAAASPGTSDCWSVGLSMSQRGWCTLFDTAIMPESTRLGMSCSRRTSGGSDVGCRPPFFHSTLLALAGCSALSKYFRRRAPELVHEADLVLKGRVSLKTPAAHHHERQL